MGSVVVVAPRPPEVDQLIEKRHRLGQDLMDEVWDGDYHMVPAPTGHHASADFDLLGVLFPRIRRAGLRGATICNIGRPGDYRVPDQAYFAPSTPPQTYHPTAEMVVEVISPKDESYVKLGFYFDAGVREALFIDPAERRIEWFVRGVEDFVPAKGSEILGITIEELADELGWRS